MKSCFRKFSTNKDYLQELDLVLVVTLVCQEKRQQKLVEALRFREIGECGALVQLHAELENERELEEDFVEVQTLPRFYLQLLC